MEQIKNQSRRDFVKASAAVGGGLTLGFYLPGKANVALADAATGYAMPNAWIKVTPDNQVTVQRNGSFTPATSR